MGLCRGVVARISVDGLTVARPNAATSVELTVFSKTGGLLSKRIELIADKVVSDGSACTMARGVAKRVTLGHVGELAALIEALNSSQAIALGSLRDDLPDEVEHPHQARARQGADQGHRRPHRLRTSLPARSGRAGAVRF